MHAVGMGEQWDRSISLFNFRRLFRQSAFILITSGYLKSTREVFSVVIFGLANPQQDDFTLFLFHFSRLSPVSITIFSLVFLIIHPQRV